MTQDMMSTGLHLDQAPPLSIPLRFFATAPLCLAAAGCFALAFGDGLLVSRYLGVTIAFTHLITIGALVMAAVGALYQMAPVVAAAPIPAVGFARTVHVALVVGVLCLVASLALPSRVVMYGAFTALSLAWLGFAVPMLIALWRSPARSEATVRGMLLALCVLLVVWFVGTWIAHGHAYGRFPGPRAFFIAAHMGLALLGAFGALIMAVSFQVLPMFYLAEPPAPRIQQALIGAAAFSVVGACVLWIVGGFVQPGVAPWLAFAFVPAAAVVWLVHPWLSMRALGARRRRRADASLRFWKLGLGMAPLTLVAAIAASQLDDPRAETLFGWIAIFGWALAIMHGMLYRIVPFLVWFHRLSPLVGIVPVPPAGKLLSTHGPRLAFALHAAALASGVVAILSYSDVMTRITGLLLVTMGATLTTELWRVARYRPPVVADQN